MSSTFIVNDRAHSLRGICNKTSSVRGPLSLDDLFPLTKESRGEAGVREAVYILFFEIFSSNKSLDLTHT